MSEKAAAPARADQTLALPWEREASDQTEAAKDFVDSLFDEDSGTTGDEADTDPGRSKDDEPDESDEEESESDEDEDDDSEEDDGSDEEEEFESDEDEDDDSEEDDEEAKTWKLKYDGEEITVDEKELTDGYLRHADYTRKRQRDADEHRDAMKDMRERRELLDAKLETVEKVLKELGPKAPDPELRTKNPGEFAAQTLAYEAFQNRIAGVSGAREEISDERKRELEDWRAERIAEAREKLAAAVPEWRADPAQADRDMQALGEFLQKQWGFTKEELGNVMDHRLVLMALENMRAQEKQARGQDKVRDKRKKKSKKLGAGGSEREPTRVKDRKKGKSSKRERDRASQAFTQSGSVRDAARLIAMDLDEGY